MRALSFTRSLLRLFATIRLAAGVALLTAGLWAAPESALNSQIYVAGVFGASLVHAASHAHPLTRGASYSAEGAVVETMSSAHASLVLSNGTALSLGAQTKLHVLAFSQTPFPAKWTDLDAEPSNSQVVIELTSGTVGVCTSRLAPGSLFKILTPHGSIAVSGGKLMIEVEETETRVLLIEGIVSATANANDAEAQPLRAGQQAILRKNLRDTAARIFIQPVMDEQQAHLDEIVARARLARRTVFFQPVESVDGVLSLQAFQIAPDAPSGGFFLKPAEITH